MSFLSFFVRFIRLIVEKEVLIVDISEAKSVIRNKTPVEMTGPPDFTGIQYTVRGLIMRLGHDRQTAQPCWVYYVELMDKTGCITIAPLEKVMRK